MADTNYDDIIKFIFHDVGIMSDVEDGAIHMLCSDFSIEVLRTHGRDIEK